MLSSQGIAVLLLCTVGQAIPRHDMRNPLDEVQRELAIQPRHFEPVSDNVGIPITSSTNYRTMPPGTYTESISSGLVRIIVVNPTPTTTNVICPVDCDCSGIKDKQSPE
ncbi:unnamed protein product [Fusarium venenatum]|uniref:Uncharacterized protein n=1 Tax=Fusarium venenatum TaxID=56646 RepID=A0A2L2TV80_9HYPO|nr:uncharacterized protein FVRRES_08283 [Fusarium venenatum]KAH6965071.1 hypothetical protein EDB82DRAFT_511512 [Fusarium venenatum]CEI68206.1 unnamed protein product [Fusarium venenatum]